MPPRRASGRRLPRTAAQAQRLLDLLNALGSTTFRQLLWQRASELDLTFAQSQVLFYVADHPACAMGEVAKAFGDLQTRYYYDGVGNIVRVTGANGNALYTTYFDALGRTIATANQAGMNQTGLTVLDHDAYGNVTRTVRYARVRR